MTTDALAVRFHELGGPDVLKIEEVRLDAPGPGEVHIRVDAIGLNRAEALFRSGGYYYQPALPGSRLGYEAAGVIESVGEGVTDFAPGETVMTGPHIEMSAQGVYGDLIALPVRSVVRRPASTDAVTGAATWLTYATAYGGMVETGGLRPGDHVVITAASSGVGTAAIQIARRTGAVPIAVTRTGAKRQQLLEIGAAHVIASDEEDVAKEVARLTDGSGAELVFDAIGGAALPTLALSAAPAGTVVVYGWLGGQPTIMPVNFPITVHGYANMHLSGTESGRRRINGYIEAGLHDGTLRPVIGEVFNGLERIADAHRLMESNTHTGKIVVTVDH